MQDANLPGGETPDAPYRALDMLTAGLAKRLARIYPPPGVDPIQFYTARKADYDEAWMYFAAQDTENVAISIQPAIGGYYR